MIRVIELVGALTFAEASITFHGNSSWGTLPRDPCA